MARRGGSPHDLLGTPGRAWLALGSLGASVAAGSLYVAGWRGMLLGFLGEVQMAALMVTSAAFMAGGVGAAAAWHLLWRGVTFVPGPRRDGRPRPSPVPYPPGSPSRTGTRGGGGARRVSAPADAPHRPPLLSFGLVNLAAGLVMVVLLLARRALVAEFAAGPQAYLWPAGLDLPYRFLLVLIVIGPPLFLLGFGAGIMLHGWGRPRLGGNESDWYHGLELPAALLSGIGLGLAAWALLAALRMPYTDGVLLASLASLVVAGVTVGVSERLALDEQWPAERRPTGRSGFRWRRFRVLTLLMGVPLGGYLVSAEVVRRRAAAGTAVGPLSEALVTALAALLAGMILRPLVRGFRRPERSEAGYALLVTGCVGLTALLWLGRLGHRQLTGAGVTGLARSLAPLAAAAPLVGLGWIMAWAIGASRHVGNRHARVAAGMGPFSAGAGLSSILVGALVVPVAGAEAGAMVAMLVLVLIGTVVLVTSRDRPNSVRLSAIGAALLVASGLLASIRQSGVYEARSGGRGWTRLSAGLLGEVTQAGRHGPRLNGVPLAGTREPDWVARLRAAVPLGACARPERVLIHVGGDRRLLEALAVPGRQATGPGNGASHPRLVVWSAQVPGVCRWRGAGGPALADLFSPPVVRLREAVPALPEHVSWGAGVRYDLVLVDLRAAGSLEAVRLAGAETVSAISRRLDAGGQVWCWLPIERLTVRGLRALLAAWLDARDYYGGVWLWELEDGGPVLCALVAAREPLIRVLSPRPAGGLLPGQAWNVAEGLMVLEGSWPTGLERESLSLERPPPRLFRWRDTFPGDEAARRAVVENLAEIRTICRRLRALSGS